MWKTPSKNITDVCQVFRHSSDRGVLDGVVQRSDAKLDGILHISVANCSTNPSNRKAAFLRSLKFEYSVRDFLIKQKAQK